jgi:hypothetical protein
MAHDSHDHFRLVQAGLSGFNEVHFVGGPPAALRGAIFTEAKGWFKAAIDKRDDVIHYALNYQDLRGAVTQAHIHFGQKHTVGGIVVWLCQTVGTPAPAAVAALTPLCPAEGTVIGKITPAQVLAQALQGFAAEDFEGLVKAILNGAAYVNVHSEVFGPGEIRGQVED